MKRVQDDPFTPRNPPVVRSPTSLTGEGPRQLRPRAKITETSDQSISRVDLTEIEENRPVGEGKETKKDKEGSPASRVTEEVEVQVERGDSEEADRDEGVEEKTAEEDAIERGIRDVGEALEAIKGAISREANSKIAFTRADQGTVRNNCDRISRFCLELVLALNRRQGEVVRAVGMVFGSRGQGDHLAGGGGPVPAARREERDQRQGARSAAKNAVERKLTGSEGEEDKGQGEGEKKKRRRNRKKKRKKEGRDTKVREAMQRSDTPPIEPEVMVTERVTKGATARPWVEVVRGRGNRNATVASSAGGSEARRVRSSAAPLKKKEEKKSYATLVRQEPERLQLVTRVAIGGKNGIEAAREVMKILQRHPTVKPLEKVIPTQRGVVVLESGSPEEAKKLKDILVKEKEVKVLKSESGGEDLTVTVHGLDSASRPEEILQGLFLENTELSSGLAVTEWVGGCKFRQTRKASGRGRSVDLVFTVNPTIFARFARADRVSCGKVWRRVTLGDVVSRCYRCCRFGHRARQCRERMCCARCGGEHLIVSCKETTTDCPSCRRAGRPKEERSHTAAWKECPAFREELQRAIAAGGKPSP